MKDRATSKIIAIAIIGALCFAASLLVLGLVAERKGRFNEAKQEVAQTWGMPQVMEGPALTFASTTPADSAEAVVVYHVLPKQVHYEVTLDPEVRSRGIFDSVVYTGTLRVTGFFSAEDIADVEIPVLKRQQPTFSVGITDTRGIEQQVEVEWNGKSLPLSPGAGEHALDASTGLHAKVPLLVKDEYPFAFEIALKGSEGIQFIPVGEETEVRVASTWKSPKFTGNYLPVERTITSEGFDALWRVSSFGRSYPQVLEGLSSQSEIQSSAFGVDLFEGVDLYTKMTRSIKYAVLFIAVTFIAFALFEVLLGLQIHSVQYLLVGLALALFYLLLLSLSEHIGFGRAYLAATGMITVLITGYSHTVLRNRRRTALICAVLAVLYGYLYFILQLEDYALLFGSLLLFALLASVMYLTRKIDWYRLSMKESDAK